MLPHTPAVDLSDVRGGALVVGFVLLLTVLYAPDPASALDRATASAGAAAYFLVLPVVGIGAGVYAYVGGAYAGGPTFAMGSYLGVFGIGLTFGTLVAADPSTLLLFGGVAIVGCALTALVGSLWGLVESIGVGIPGAPPE